MTDRPDHFRLRLAARLLREGAVIAYPTEAVFGLGCDPLNRRAVYRLLAIKQRPVEKGLILIASDISQLLPFVSIPSTVLRAELEATWPGPVTWLLPTRPETPKWLRGEHTTIAVRVTAHPVAAALCDAFGGPIVSTSANASGRPPARTALQARRRCPGIDAILNGKTGGRARPTEIRDAATGRTVRPA
ncbi:L-threonylcarbamoyladenylate synthase [Thiosocius teredinicola]|uniref:L-threonylcarbamoyladenylate synthase n=1 Tax=Thiosocius teredinicola TaxID=1973002 RepID=UPI000990F92C